MMGAADSFSYIPNNLGESGHLWSMFWAMPSSDGVRKLVADATAGCGERLDRQAGSMNL
jgi:hypothetical protein